MTRANRLLAPAVFLMAASCFAQQQDCAPTGVKLAYPRLARAARVTGTVTVRLLIQSTGTVQIVKLDGKPLFLTSARQSMTAIRYPAACAGPEVDLTLRYILDVSEKSEEETTQLSSTEFAITAGAIIVDHSPQ